VRIGLGMGIVQGDGDSQGILPLQDHRVTSIAADPAGTFRC
jgi:hypothetical protein